MHKFGIKVVDKNCDRLGPVLEDAISYRRRVEVRLFHGDTRALELLERQVCNAPIEEHFPFEVKVFEVDTEQAIANLEAGAAARHFHDVDPALALPEKFLRHPRSRSSGQRHRAV